MPSEALEEPLLRLFAEPDEVRAGRAFAELARPARGWLHARLRSALPDPGEREDVIQETLCAVWQYRARYRPRGVAAWYALLRRAAHHRLIDRARARGPATVELSEDFEPPAPEVTEEEEFRRFCAVEARRLRRLADALWLGFSPTENPRKTTRRLLAAQLFYRDGLPWQAVLRILAGSGRGTGPHSRQELDEWLAAPAAARQLAFSHLYCSGEALERLLVGTEDERPVAAGSPEASAVGWRYRLGLPVEQVLARRDCCLSREALLALHDRCRAAFPFERLMNELLEALERHPTGHRELADAGLWKRLVFEYSYRDGLTQRDILDRLQPAAARASYRLTAGMLNVWLSNGRLTQSLSRFLALHTPEAGDAV